MFTDISLFLVKGMQHFTIGFVTIALFGLATAVIYVLLELKEFALVMLTIILISALLGFTITEASL